MRVERVGVLGCGLMGSGIAEVVARAGYEVRVVELNEGALEAGSARLVRSLERAVEREKISVQERDRSLDRISYHTDLGQLSDRDLIVEAVVEKLDVKNELFGELDALCPDRVIGLHFFNPVPVMNLVEIVYTIATSESTLECVTAFARSLGKETVTVRDSSGFVVNRLLMPFMLDAIRLVETGVASIEELDKSMVLGCGHPMGPLTLCDFVGNDTVHRIAEIMYAEYRSERYAPPPLLKRLVTMGRFGRKSGAGFYDYSGKDPVAISL